MANAGMSGRLSFRRHFKSEDSARLDLTETRRTRTASWAAASVFTQFLHVVAPISLYPTNA